MVAGEELGWRGEDEGLAEVVAEVELGVLQPVAFGFVEEDGEWAECFLHFGEAGDVIDVGVGEDDGLWDEVVLFDVGDCRGGAEGGIDDPAIGEAFVVDDVGIGGEGA